MHFELVNYVPPSIDLNTQVKRQCRVPTDYSGDDVILTDYLNGAIEQVEGDAERVLGYADCIVTLDTCEGRMDGEGLTHFRWPVVPLVAAPADVTVEYLGTDNTWHTVSSPTVFVLPGDPATMAVDLQDITFHQNESLPRLRITAAVGYNTDVEADDYKPLPRNALPAILLWVAESYANREAVVYSKATAEFLRAYNKKIAGLRWRVYP